ncbi:pyridoxal phosphate-dependent transferase [Aspergillus desertorum]
MGSTGTGAPVDLSHHINRKSKARHASPLKDIIKPPPPVPLPLHAARFDCLPPSSSMPDPDEGGAADDLVSLTLGRGSSPSVLDLTRSLQYGSGTGNKQLLALCREITDKVHSPPCSYECLLHPGNTNAWAKVVGMLCEDDDFVLVEEYTYPSAQALWIPLGVRAVPVSADAQGISANVLRDVLATWDEKGRGARRPKAISCCRWVEPTGLSISTERRKEIYDVCVEFDIVIVEDDPYYFLQYPRCSLSANPSATEFNLLDIPSFLKSLTPSFLALDTQSRVIRLESFSKTIFPERLLRATEVETQDPAGLSQAFALALLRNWGVDGYLEWLQRLRGQYRLAVDSPLPKAEGYVACLETRTGDEASLRLHRPEAGMFVWSKWYFAGVERFAELSASDEVDPEQSFATELWAAWASELVLVTPGSYYHPWQGTDTVTTRERGAEEGGSFQVLVCDANGGAD